MAGTKMASQTPLDERVEEFIIASLRDEHPYMRIDAVYNVAKACADAVKNKVTDEETEMAKAKQRISFMSLPRELRDHVYELALRPQNDGDGGIKGCRAIFMSVDCKSDNMQDYSFGYYRSTSWVKQPAITMVSRQTRSESLPVYYGSNCFVIQSTTENDWASMSEDSLTGEEELYWDFEFHGAERWLRAMGKQNVNLIKHLEVCYEMDYRSHGDIIPKMKDLTEYLKHFDIPPITATPLAMGYFRDKGWVWLPLEDTKQARDEVLARTLPEHEDDSMAYLSV